MKITQKGQTMRMLREFISMYKEDGYIDGDCLFHVLYRNGAVFSYPDDADRIKLRNILNVWYFTACDCGDFTHDFIGTQEQYNFIFNEQHGGNPLFKPRSPLILDESVDFGRVFEGGAA
jgi:hypothetical protein